MNKLLTLQDSGKWHVQLRAEATSRHWATKVVRSVIDLEPGAVFFARVSQNFADRMTEIPIITEAEKIGVKLIPDAPLLLEYESKIMQQARYHDWMPETLYLADQLEAYGAIDTLEYPFVSKSSTGSASCNVRMIKNQSQAITEIETAFSDVGLEAPHGLGEKNQRGYLLWQKFLPGNDYDYRACIIGNKVMLLRRGNRKDIPFASGSGNTEPVITLDSETKSVLEFAFEFFRAFGMHWAGIDIVKDHDTGQWRMLETTIGWKQSAYEKCAFYDRDAVPSGWGSDIWKIYCDYIRRYM